MPADTSPPAYLTTEAVALSLSVSERTLRELYRSASAQLRARPDAPIPVGVGSQRLRLRWPAAGYTTWVSAASSAARAPQAAPSTAPSSLLTEAGKRVRK